MRKLIHRVFPFLLNNAYPALETDSAPLPKLPALLAVALFDEVPYCRQVAVNMVCALLTVTEMRNFPVPLENLTHDRFYERLATMGAGPGGLGGAGPSGGAAGLEARKSAVCKHAVMY